MAEEQSKVGEASVPSPTAEASAGWSCSRCVAIRTAVEPLAWTLSTLRQTGQGEAPRSRWLRSESVEATSTAELLRQYRLLQVGVWGVGEGQTRSASEQPVVIKSPIQGWGLFASSPLMKGMMVMEFVGEVVSQEVANAREAMYEEMDVGGCYFFRLDAEHIVDATVKGNESRFINHCCDPNCDARVVNINNENKILFFAKRDIVPGEEITYDYKFQYEDKELVCLCGSKHCTGRMNWRVCDKQWTP